MNRGVYTPPVLDTDELRMTSWNRIVSVAFEKRGPDFKPFN